MTPKKLKIGWFTFTCCEDSTIVFTELLNTYYKEWKQTIDFVHIKVLKSRNRITNMDVAFVEGSISSQSQENKLKQIRALATKLIAIGACACIGMPSSQRNQFTPELIQEIQPLLNRFQYKSPVRKLSDVVVVDDQVNGCPMNEQVFLKVLNKYLGEFGCA